MSILLKNATIITSNEEKCADIYIEGGKIADIGNLGTKYEGEKLKTYDLTGHYLFPGLVDVHVHFRDPGLEYKEDVESGSKAAVKGGFTAVACMANTTPVNDSATVTEKICNTAKEVNLCDVYPIGAATKGLKGEALAEIGDMKRSGIIAVSDDGMPVNSASMARKVFEYATTFGLPIIAHCEECCLSKKGQIHESFTSTELGLKGIPSASETVMVYRDIELARLTGAHLHIAHVSSGESVRLIERAKKEGVNVTAEVTPHHLYMCIDDFEPYDTNFKVNPPIRNREDRRALLDGLKKGVIDMIASDHAPHHVIEKDLEFDHAPCGINGLETVFPVLLELVRKKKLSLSDIAERYSSAPSRVFGLPINSLEIGSDANIAIVDPEREEEISQKFFTSKCHNTPLLGKTLKGFNVMTLNKGRVVYRDSALKPD